MRRAQIVVAVLLALVSLAAADTWGSYGRRRYVGPHGRHYVVVRGESLTVGAPFVLARLTPGAPPVEPREVHDSWTKVGKGKPEPLTRPGDEVLARGGLADTPYDVLVSGTGLGFAAVETWGMLGSGDTLVIVSRDGSLQHRLRIHDLFEPIERLRFTQSFSSLWWYRGGWIDDEAREVVLCPADGDLRIVDWDTGEIRRGTKPRVARALSHGDPRIRTLALELISESRIKGLDERIAVLLAGETQPLRIRLRAAIALAVVSGDRRGKALVLKTALMKTSSDRPDPSGLFEIDPENNPRGLAIEHLPELFGESALEQIERAAPRDPEAAAAAVAKLGDGVVPRLIELVEKEGAPWAAAGLGKLGSRRALPVLLAAIASSDESLVFWAVESASAIAGREILPDLEALKSGGVSSKWLDWEIESLRKRR
jgi:hypothetical protein